jgi:orotate phosphoribosyltransferase-like protein
MKTVDEAIKSKALEMVKNGATADEAAKYANVSPGTIYVWKKGGYTAMRKARAERSGYDVKLPAVKVGKPAKDMDAIAFQAFVKISDTLVKLSKDKREHVLQAAQILFQ